MDKFQNIPMNIAKCGIMGYTEISLFMHFIMERYISYVDKDPPRVSYVYNIYALVLLQETAYSDKVHQNIPIYYGGDICERAV